MFWRITHDFFKWFWPAAFGGCFAIAGIAVAASQVWPEAKAWTASSFQSVSAVMSQSWFIPLALGIFAIWLAAFLWSGHCVNKAKFERERPQNGKPDSLETVLTVEPGQLVLTNLSDDSIWLAGTKLGDVERDLEAIPRQVPKGHFYYLLINKLEIWAIEKFGLNARQLVPLEFYLWGPEKLTKYIAKCALLIVITDGSVTLHPQNLGTESANW